MQPKRQTSDHETLYEASSNLINIVLQAVCRKDGLVNKPNDYNNQKGQDAGRNDGNGYSFQNAEPWYQHSCDDAVQSINDEGNCKKGLVWPQG
jgi:hypothetical protein